MFLLNRTGKLSNSDLAPITGSFKDSWSPVSFSHQSDSTWLPYLEVQTTINWIVFIFTVYNYFHFKAKIAESPAANS